MMKVSWLLMFGSISVTAINLADLGAHKSSDSCWISLKGEVYDVTDFLPKHPGGRQIMLRQCGTIADKNFDAVHDSLPAVLKVAGNDVKHMGAYSGADAQEEKPSTRNRDFKMDETNLTPFAKTALHHVHNHPIVQKNAYTEWFAKGAANLEQVKDLVTQFSVFSSLFMLAQLQKTLNAPTLQEMREGKEILLNELGTVFKPVEGKARRDQQSGVGGVGDMEVDPKLVSTEGTVDGGTYYHKAAHFEWLLNVGTSLGIDYKDLGKRKHGTNSTLFFCDQLYNIYGSDDLSTSLGASFAIENWANAGFWDDLVDGFQAFNNKGPTKTPMGFWLFHQALEGQHASHTMDELEEAIEGGRITDQAKFLKAADDMLDAVAVFWNDMPGNWRTSTRNRDFKMDESNLTPFAKTALHHVHNHPIVQRNEYTEWFAKGTATLGEVKDLVTQFSVFSSLFMLAQLQKTLNAPTLHEMREGKEILLNELGTVFTAAEGKARRDQQSGVGGVGDMEVDPKLVSTEGTVDGGTYFHKAAHFEWLLNVGASLGIEYKDLGKRKHGTNSTLFFCDQLYNIYGSDDLSTSLGASFAIENWANAGFWDDLVDGFQAFNAKGTKTPMGFWLFHQALEGQHASHTMDELEEAIAGGRITDQAKFLKAADDMLAAVAVFWNGMPRNSMHKNEL